MSWWHRLLHRKRLDEQLEKELHFHLDRQAADLVERGQSSEEALRQARLTAGGADQVKEACRDARGTRWLEDLWLDLRYALRTLRRKPAFAVVALLTLALGTGATTILFTVFHGVLLKPMAYPQPDRLVVVSGKMQSSAVPGDDGQQPLSNPDFIDCQREVRSMDLAGGFFGDGILSSHTFAEHVNQFLATPNLFAVLGVPLFRGRTFLPEENHAGAAPVLILGYSLWQRRYGGSPETLGSPVVMDGKRYTVVGITAEGFRLDGQDMDVYLPIGQNTGAFLQRRDVLPVVPMGRLRPSATMEQAQAELSVIGHRLAEQYPGTNKDRGFVVRQFRPDVGDVRSSLWLLLGAVSVVLLIACVNVASLLLARAVSREREIAMRAALGASRGRLARQCLTESVVLGICGGLLGLLLAAAGIRPFVAWWPGSLPRAEEVHLDWTVLLFGFGVSLVCGLLFGLAPALRAPSRDLEQVLRAGARTVSGPSRRLHGSFVVAEIALTMVLLLAAGMLGRTLLYLSSLNPGLNVRNVLIARTGISPSVLSSPEKIRAGWQAVLDRVRRVPGVEAAAIVDTVPMREGNNQINYWTTPAKPAQNQLPVVLAISVTPDYLRVMGLQLRQGRFLEDRDRMGGENVAVIDDVLAREAFPGEPAVGKHLWIDFGASSPESVQVVGVVDHVRHWGPATDDQARVRAQLYYPFAQVPDKFVRRWSELMSLAVRTRTAPLSTLEALRNEVRGDTGDQVLYDVRTMEQLSQGTLARQRFLLLLFGIFAGLALLLACIGIYGVLAYLTGQRVPEIGVRMALGAGSREVLWMVLRQSLGMIFAGIAIGAVIALAVGSVLESAVEGMRPAAPSTFAVMIPALLLAALAASFLPAYKASRVDPMKALRQ